MNGVLIIDKPAGLTSHDVVNRARRILRERSIGHLGTLDPMATGVLPLVTGNLTRLAQFYTTSEKSYEGAIRFGFATDTYDVEGEVTTTPQEVKLRAEEVEALAARFRGVIQQTPPPFSAKKIKGVPAYKLARQQKEVVLKPVQVEIKEFVILEVASDRVRFRARVASGTYMRSVAHEMGRELACGAHLESLRRTSVAEFTIADAHTLEEVSEACGAGAPARVAASVKEEEEEEKEKEDGNLGNEEIPRSEALVNLFIHPRKLLPNLPSVTADEPTAARVRSGRTVNLPELSRARQVKVFSSQTELLAIATRIAGTLFHPKIVLCGTGTPGTDTPFGKLRAGSVRRL
jgi:tRNA pseudouridine55 synthase